MILFLLGVLGCQPHQAPVQALGSGAAHPSGYLVIAHTNDTHAHFSPSRAPWLEAAPDIGGFAAIAGAVEALHVQAGDDHVLYLDGGDVMTGTPLMEFEVRGVRGGAMLDFMETAGLDAWVLGNHEFDIGFDHVSALVGASRVPVLSANLDALDGSGAPGIMGLVDHTIFERDGLKVGVFGLTTASLGRLTASGAAEKLNVRDVIAVAREQVEALASQVDLVVALTHIGVDMDKRLAAEVAGIDLIVGGHSHTPLTEALKVQDTWIVQAGCYARQLGVTEMTVKDGRIVAFEARLQDLLPGSSPVHSASASLQKTWEERIDAHFSVVLGKLEGGDLDRGDHAETALGRWAADTVREAAGTDLGLYNPGGLRADLVEGAVTRGAVYTVFPFGNTIVTFNLRGADLVGLLLRNANSALSGKHPPMQMSGVTAQWRKRSGVAELVAAEVGGSPIEIEATYTMATNSYIAAQWKYNLGFHPVDLNDIGVTVYQAALERVSKAVLTPPKNPRITRID